MPERQLPHSCSSASPAIKLQQIRLGSYRASTRNERNDRVKQCDCTSTLLGGTLLNWYSTPNYPRSDKVENLKFGIDA